MQNQQEQFINNLKVRIFDLQEGNTNLSVILQEVAKVSNFPMEEGEQINPDELIKHIASLTPKAGRKSKPKAK